MTKPAVRKLHLHFHETVKGRLETDAGERERSLNDVVVGHLAKHYEVPFEGTGRKSPGANGALTMNLRLPARIYDRVHRDSFRTERSKNEIVERILCSAYGIEYVAHTNGRPVAA